MKQLRISAKIRTAPGWGYRAVVFRRCGRPGGICLLTAGAALLAALGVSGVSPPAALAMSSALTWIKQAPAASPSARDSAAMVYDPAARNVVLFGGRGPGGRAFGDTWVWNG